MAPNSDDFDDDPYAEFEELSVAETEPEPVDFQSAPTAQPFSSANPFQQGADPRSSQPDYMYNPDNRYSQQQSAFGAGLPTPPVYQQHGGYIPSPMPIAMPTNQHGRSSVVSAAVLSIFLSLFGALLLQGGHGGNPLARANLRQVMNQQLTAVLVLIFGGIVGHINTTLGDILGWSPALYFVLAIITASSIGKAFDQGEVYKPILSFPFLK